MGPKGKDAVFVVMFRKGWFIMGKKNRQKLRDKWPEINQFQNKPST